jgi:hypothetical protein
MSSVGHRLIRDRSWGILRFEGDVDPETILDATRRDSTGSFTL